MARSFSRPDFIATSRRFARSGLFFLALSSALGAEPAPLQVIVMDPLSLPLSCTCLPGVGQRRYDLLAQHLEKFVGRTVKVTFDESIALAQGRTGGQAGVIIGKDSVVRFDAAKARTPIRTLAALSDKAGSTQLKGVFLVRNNHPAKTVADLAGRTVSISPVEDEDSHAAAVRALPGAKWLTAGSLDAAALALSDGEADAAVVSDFLPPLLESCGKLDKSATQVLGETAPVPFIRVFTTVSVDADLEQAIMLGLIAVSDSPKLLAALESKAGFVDLREEMVMAWTDWRGPDRAGFVPQLPAELPAKLEGVWSSPLTSPALAGPAATEQFVIVPDKSGDFKRDLFRCLNARDGREVWRLEYDAPDPLDYSNAPRATPVVHDGLVYLQGALGHLHCVRLATGTVEWKIHLFRDFGAKRLTWGASVPPLILDDKLIVSPGGKSASVVALDRRTGQALWKTPGHAAAYSAFISGTFDGVKQIVGYDVAGLGGWDPQTGRRLWELIPADGTDFNVTTPIILGRNILLATENNAVRLYPFDGHGRLAPKPVLKNEELAPDTCTPAVVNGRVFATAYGKLFCLDANNGLKTVWRVSDEMFHEHSSIVGGKDRILIWMMSGDLLLVDADADRYKLISHLRPYEEKSLDSMAHPAFVGDRIYLRSKKELVCLRFPMDER